MYNFVRTQQQSPPHSANWFCTRAHSRRYSGSKYRAGIAGSSLSGIDQVQCSGAIGGILYDDSGYDGSAGGATLNESFSLSADEWKTTLLAISQGTIYPASTVANGQLYCLGGSAVLNGAAISNVQIYQP
jgi:hypothetical protein